jgi:osmotically-inducible protein OsmY
MNSKSLITLSSLAVVLALAACDKNDERTAGQQLDSAVANAKQETKEAAASTSEAVNNAAEATKTAGANAMDATFDAGITAKINAGLAADKDLSATRIDVDTKDGVVTLTGPVPNDAAKDRAADIAKNVKDVKSVNNQLTVKAAG